MIEKLFAFLDFEVMHSSPETGKQLRALLEQKINTKVSSSGIKPIPVKIANQVPSLLKDMDPKEVARQLTLIEYSLYSKIQVWKISVRLLDSTLNFWMRSGV